MSGPFLPPIDPEGPIVIGPMVPGAPGQGAGEQGEIPDNETQGLGPMPMLIIVCARDMTSLKITGRR
jgi:hypothetical protein